MGGTPIAIVTGKGRLPEILAATLTRAGRKVILVMFSEYRPVWGDKYQCIQAPFEKPGIMFDGLADYGCKDIVFAGSMVRPSLNPLKFDKKMLAISVRLLAALKGGDNAGFNVIRKMFETEGLTIHGAHEFLEHLLAPSGTLTKAAPSQDDFNDIDRARSITGQLGLADVGQGAVVGQGLCLGLESIQGTDAMLDFIADNAAQYRPDPDGGQGVLVKAPKLGQDWRIDLPAIGPETVKHAAKAGLAGIAVQAGGVLILGVEETVAAADKAGLFIHAFDPEASS
jgi:UDP-2,3-diacylglucosamine hydrolase